MIISLLLVVNPNTGKPTGSVNMWGKVVLSYWRNIYIGRNKAANVTQQGTIPQANTRYLAVVYGTRYDEVLTDDQRKTWEDYAGSLGSAVDREKSDSIAKTKNVIPKRGKVMSGKNAYIKSNIVEFLADGGGPDDIAPVADFTPPPPTAVTLHITAPVPHVTWTDPILIGTPTKKKARLWIKLDTKPKIHSQLLAHINFGVGQYDITTVRIKRAEMPIQSFPGAIIRVQMDTVIQAATGHGAIIGPGSNVAEIRLLG